MRDKIINYSFFKKQCVGPLPFNEKTEMPAVLKNNILKAVPRITNLGGIKNNKEVAADWRFVQCGFLWNRRL